MILSDGRCIRTEYQAGKHALMQNNARASTHTVRSASRAGREQWTAWLALVLAVAVVVTLYLALSLSVSADPLLMPLDDTYIHFQYARQMAHGQPMVYVDGDPATTGGTSLLYPPLLALGYIVGFTGWALAYWALGVGVLAFLGSAWLVYRIGHALLLEEDAPDSSRHALIMALAFAVSGPFVWAALSGMETALFVFLTLLTLRQFQQSRLYSTVFAALLLTLCRPEGMALSAIVMGALAVRVHWSEAWRARVQRAATLVLPVLAAVIQPGINLLVTGSTSSSGMQAKSHLYNSSVSVGERLRDVGDFWLRIWQELLTGRSADWGTFTPWLLSVMAFAALLAGGVMAWRRRRVTLPLVMIAWMLALTLGVATLDTAFWQFKRYQLPVAALLFPAAGWSSALLGSWFTSRLGHRWAQWAVPLIILLGSALTGLSFAQKYAVNVLVVRDQQVPMARWTREHVPPGARIGVHDVGMMGYFGEHPLYDVVGLTLPGPSESWRQGPGAIYEHMAHSEYRSQYFAIYPDVQGLRYLVNAGVFGAVLAEFPVDLPADNVAAALDYQAVYPADWSATRAREQVAQTTTLAALRGFALVDQVDVAELESESAHNYDWWQRVQPEGFVTEMYRHTYHACGLSVEADCWAADGGRVLTGGETFTLTTHPGADLLLVTRVHGRESTPLTVYANGERVASRVQPALPGRWVEIVTLVEAHIITDVETRIRIDSDGVYMPYYHWAYQGAFEAAPQGADRPAAEFGDNAQIDLMDVAVSGAPGQVDVTVTWRGPAAQTGDGVVFVHLYNRNEIATEPIAQVVMRPAGGVLPPENWLPGTIEDTYTVLLPDDLQPGDYVVALGLFDNRSGQRYPVASDTLLVDDGRLFIGDITVEELSSED